MADARKLSVVEIEDAFRRLDGWSVIDGKLHRKFGFADFTEAFRFMTKVAIKANGMWRHPELYNVWSKVVIDLVTHGADGSISDLDVQFAAKIDTLA